MFIVMGITGEYSDRSEWPVCIYDTEELAQKHAEEAEKQAARMFASASHRWDIVPDDEAKVWDENMNFDYTGTSYFVYEAPHKAELPTFSNLVNGG